MRITGYCIKINKNDPEYLGYYGNGKPRESLAFDFSFLAAEYEIDSYNGINYMYIYSDSIGDGSDFQYLINYIEDVYEKN